MKKVKGVIENLIIVMLIFILVVVVIGKLQLNYYNPYPSFMGFRSLTVLTGSMSPKIKPGDIVIIKEVNSNNIEVGDVVTYKTDNLLITHRVNKIITNDNELQFITKGDANNTVDTDAIRANQIMGKKIFSVPYAGYVVNFFTKNFVLFPLFIIAFVAITAIKEIIKKSKLSKTQ